jgi:RimJ/RimL family protein N-acetyltransferase
MLRPATPDDIPAIMAMERLPGHLRFVGQWEAGYHAEQLADPNNRYFVWRENGAVLGFVILQEVNEANLCALLRRICVAEPGTGLGGRILRAVIDEAFGTLGRHRLDLWTHEDNHRAIACYRRAGFSDEGLARDLHRDNDGSFRSMKLMGILATDPRP